MCVRASLVLLLASTVLAQEKPATASTSGLKELIELVKSKEQSVKSVQLKMTTTGRYPDGREFSTSGTMRLLGRTHVHTAMTAKFAQDVVSETETVTTPDGVWTREKDPTHGEIYLRIRPELVAQLKEAAEVLGRTDQVAGQADNRVDAPLGSAMLEDFALQYELSVSETKLEGEDYFVAKGAARADPKAPADMLQATEIELLVRKRDGIVMRMVQFAEAKPILSVQISDVLLNAEMETKSFVIALPSSQRWRDIKDHPPAWYQIQATLDEANAKAVEQAKKAGGTIPGKKRDG